MVTRPETGAVLITGGSGGIGFALAKRFARANRNLILVSRNAADLKKAAAELKRIGNGWIRLYAVDLAVTDAAKRLCTTLKRDDLVVDTVVNNAGVGLLGAVAKLPPEDHAAMIRLNVNALVELTTYLLPKLIESGRGGILNVASTAAFLPGPNMSGYYASKAFVLSFSEGLARELKGTGITVTCLCPGPTKTMFEFRAGAQDAKLFGKTMQADEVARIGYAGFQRGKRVVIPGLRNKLTVWGINILPRRISARLAFAVNR